MKPKTIAIHHGYEKDSQKTMVVPIYQTTAYEFDSAEHAADLFNLKQEGNIYARIGNPTTGVFEKRVAALESGVAALATASGMSAIFYAVANLCEAGDNIIAPSQLYGGTLTLFTHTMKRFGVQMRVFDIDDTESIEQLIDEKTKVIYFESLSNPSVEVADIEAITKIASNHKIISVVDNTVATPSLCRPIEHGADIVVHSASKYMTGQGLAIGGVLAEAKSVQAKLKDNPRYLHFNEPDTSYHGLVYSQSSSTPFVLRARLSLLRDIGAKQSPFESWLFIQGLETLDLRMREHSKNAFEIAKFLKDHPRVKEVSYPGLEGDKNAQKAKKYLKKGCSGLLSFKVSGFEEAKDISDSVKIFSRVVNIGDSKSIITHPASTTHQQLSSKELRAAGIDEGLVRLSIGLEDVYDLIEDLKQALE